MLRRKKIPCTSSVPDNLVEAKSEIYLTILRAVINTQEISITR